MSANFLDTSGNCAGLDLHLYFGAGGPAPIPVPLTPHMIFCPHKWKTRDWRIATTVTTRGNPVLQSNWAMLLVIHVPSFPMPPHPIEAVQIAGIIAAGSAAPQLTAHKVTAQGGPLCTEISGSSGLNLDCSDLISFSDDFNENTVMTQPTAGDYVAAILAAAFSALYSWGVNKLIGNKYPTDKGPVDPLNVVKAAMAGTAVAVVQTLLDLCNANVADPSWWQGDPGANVINNVTAAVQRFIDGEKS
jgi:hypothetical protein